MKKTAFIIVVFAVLVALALVFLQQGGKRALTAADIAPAETLVFLHLPDVQRSTVRWPQTALAKIGAEPEVQTFMEKPRSKAPEMKEASDTLERVQRARVGEMFVALTEADGSNAKFVAGISFAGSKADVDALLAPALAEMRKAQPDDKPGHVTHGKTEIETYTTNGNTVAICDIHGGGWRLISNDLDTLKAALDRVDGKPEAVAKSLAHNALCTGALAAVPKEGDAEVFADVEAIARRVLPLIAATGTPVPAEAQAMLKQAKAFAYSVKMDGAQFREAAFIANPGGTPQTQLPIHALALSTKATAIVLTNALPAASVFSDSSSLALVPGFADLAKALAAAGMKPEDFGKLFGPEVGAMLDWSIDEPAPSFALTLDLREAAKAKAVADALTAGNDTWTRSEHAGALVLSQKPGGPLGVMQPTIAFGDKFAVLGISTESVNAVLDRAAAPHERIDTSPAYQAATKLVAAPTSSFAYIDVKTLFERVYGTVRPLAILALALQPEVGQYIDAGKLPNTATIAQHLSPIVYSNSTTDRGTLMESSGPITLSQLSLIFGGTAAGIISTGQVKPGGALDPGSLGLPIPNLNLPGLTPAPKPAAPVLPTLPDPPTASPKPEVNPAEKSQ